MKLFGKIVTMLSKQVSDNIIVTVLLRRKMRTYYNVKCTKTNKIYKPINYFYNYYSIFYIFIKHSIILILRIFLLA